MGKKLPGIPTEFEEQAAVIKWRDMMVATGQEPRLALLHGDSSGVRVSIGLAKKMKAAGAITGWPDLFLAVPLVAEEGTYHCCGLFVELKRVKGGVVSTEQKQIHTMLRDNGYNVVVCRGADEAIRAITEYLA